MDAGWFYSPSQIARYIPSRITSLKPPRNKVTNPWKIIRSLDSHQWNMFLVGWAGWTWDAFDFFTVSLCRKSACRTDAMIHTNMPSQSLKSPTTSGKNHQTSPGASL